MDKLLRQPTGKPAVAGAARYERFGLVENPFPSEPVVNKESADRRINGDIFEAAIREKELQQIVESFLRQPQEEPNHLRLGYIIDMSYVGRGNGKSAFLLYLLHQINKEYCLDYSGGGNKCFAVYVSPEPGGRTKTYSSFVDRVFESILDSGIVPVALAALRLEALQEVNERIFQSLAGKADGEIVRLLNDPDWFRAAGVDIGQVERRVAANEYAEGLPPDFPLTRSANGLFCELLTESSLRQYYKVALKSVRDRTECVFSHMVRLFLGAHFNGAYILVDDFERIPDFQSARQKRDFALELRTCLYDGSSLNARLGFYNWLLVLHAGVPRLIGDAWAESGMEARAPMSLRAVSKHIIPFEKLSPEHVAMLLGRYLNEYRVPGTHGPSIAPFTTDAVAKIGEACEFNAARILRIAYDLLDKAADTPGQTAIDTEFVDTHMRKLTEGDERGTPAIEAAESTDLVKKAKQGS